MPLEDGPVPQPVLPAGACDAHCHVFGPFDRFPLPDDRSFTPPEAPAAALRRLHDRLGFDRAVIVHSQGHGRDHRPLLDALAADRDRTRGVAVLGPDVAAEDVARLDAAGVCGVRFNFLAHLGGAPAPERIQTVLGLVRPFDWHVAIHVTGADLIRYVDLIAAIDARVVIDHMARPDLSQNLEACRDILFRLLDSGRVWVKLSGADRFSIAGAPYHDVVPFARSLAEHAPDRVLWGSDWPHVNISGPMPDDSALVDLLPEIAPSNTLRHRLLVENPAALFGFGAASP
ncbi:2-pyrone-4,6-dicarboxylate hydrolase [Bradyrhizobium sp. SSBR45G]|uniref:amidohydrolase family protein n=1 Tax=unclassified Bradyrhizobium TaxID=2631580 RepID=UPI002342A55D|nr:MULTISPECIES: amidohydrolase family protein [unclassified Bradyrhizobium]GLH81998.1 2-pyrone-4,6-dicarboxylate hydrolase [Bradyrhizobium sp. SSBR45G]GLH85370.1 2-pyrone-4,6-dicarboxylate hydrolase [Bradyrhizobium sp. SSBR45R]